MLLRGCVLGVTEYVRTTELKNFKKMKLLTLKRKDAHEPIEGLTVGQYQAVKSFYEREGLSGMCLIYRSLIAAQVRASDAERKLQIEREKYQ